MGFLQTARNAQARAHASGLLASMLATMASQGKFAGDPSRTAARLIDDVWNSSPVLFDGTDAPRPHRNVLVASALMFELNDGNPGTKFDAYLEMLGNIISDAHRNHQEYALNEVDDHLLEICVEYFQGLLNEANLQVDATTAEEEDLPRELTWDEWFAEFKRSASEVNPVLAGDGSKTLIDFMELSPLRRAHMDGVDPRTLGVAFGESFDLEKFLSTAF